MKTFKLILDAAALGLLVTAAGAACGLGLFGAGFIGRVAWLLVTWGWSTIP